MTLRILGWTFIGQRSRISSRALGGTVLRASSLLINYMRPQTTRKSYRPRVSDRTMVDTTQPGRLFEASTSTLTSHPKNFLSREPVCSHFSIF